MATTGSTTRRLLLLCGAGLLWLAGCASGPNVRTNVDPTADFAQYKTFGFANPLGTDRTGYRSIVSQHLMDATQRELEARGLRRVEGSPQLLVNFNARLSDKLQVTPSMAPMVGGGYYGYRRGFYGAWPMYETNTVTQYTEGTLNIDLVDAARKQLVWEGVVTDTVTQSDLAAVQPALYAAVAAAFAKYPVPAAAAKASQ
ncbi:MAG TPA: DUF4136 domain-containing protein [Burkholderiaceae bacterium]